jgi:glutamate--cysteine ligase
VANAARSLQAQADIEQNDTESFTEYVARYHAALKKPATVEHS